MFKIDEYSASLTTEKKMLFNIMKLLEELNSKLEPKMDLKPDPIMTQKTEDVVTCDRCGKSEGKNGNPFTIQTIKVHKLKCKGG